MSTYKDICKGCFWRQFVSMGYAGEDSYVTCEHPLCLRNGLKGMIDLKKECCSYHTPYKYEFRKYRFFKIPQTIKCGQCKWMKHRCWLDDYNEPIKCKHPSCFKDVDFKQVNRFGVIVAGTEQKRVSNIKTMYNWQKNTCRSFSKRI